MSRIVETGVSPSEMLFGKRPGCSSVGCLLSRGFRSVGRTLQAAGFVLLAGLGCAGDDALATGMCADSDGAAGDAVGCSSVECEGGRRSCWDDGTVWTCPVDGGAPRVEDCDPNQVCADGVCVDITCEADTPPRCEGDIAITCDPDTGEVAEVCTSACESPAGCTCTDGACVARTCIPGERRCAPENTVEQCDPDGFGWTVVPGCAADQVCSAGRCETVPCTDGEAYCVGDTLVSCAAGGTLSLTTCADEGQWCNASGDAADCVDAICDAGTSVCRDDQWRAVCAPNGSRWTVQPCEEGNVCIGGVCGTPPEECTLESSSMSHCVSETTRRSCSRGAWYETPCPGSESCVLGWCERTTGPRWQDEMTCIDGELHRLNIFDDGDDPLVVCPWGCNRELNDCAPPACEPVGATWCAAGDVLTCDGDRGWVPGCVGDECPVVDCSTRGLEEGEACTFDLACASSSCSNGRCTPSGFVYVEGGEHWIGDDAVAVDFPSRQMSLSRPVTLTNDFYMAKWPLGIADRAAVRGVPLPGPGLTPFGGDSARAAPNFMSRREGLPTCYTDNAECIELRPEYATPYECPGYRFMTEAEYEIALRAGTRTPWFVEDLTTDDLETAWRVLAEYGNLYTTADREPRLGYTDPRYFMTGTSRPHPSGAFDMVGLGRHMLHENRAVDTWPVGTDPWSGEGCLRPYELRPRGGLFVLDALSADRSSSRQSGAIYRVVRTAFDGE